MTDPTGNALRANIPVRYDARTNTKIPVTQEWVDDVEYRLDMLTKVRTAAIKFLDAWKSERT